MRGGSLGVFTGRQAASKLSGSSFAKGSGATWQTSWSMVRRLLLIALATAAAAAPAGAGTAATGPSGAFFVLSCTVSHSAPDDPIVLPGLPGRSHDHYFIGNTSTDASSTPVSLARDSRTTCSDEDDLSAYWAPTLYVDGKEVTPLGVTIYYRRVTAAPVQPFPAGLEMVAGNSHAVYPQSPSVTEWYCGVLKSSFYGPLRRVQSAAPGTLPHCTPPTNLELQVNFPNCSDGKASSADHRSQMAYSSGGRCPASHPVAVPAITLILRYPAITGDNVFLSSGGVNSGHADFMDAWRAKPFAALVTSCLNHYSGCGALATGALDVPAGH